MARLGSWVKPFPEGIYVAPADAWIDPSRPKAKALVTHGHGDHARGGHEAVWATAETLAIMDCRYGPQPGHQVAYGESIRLGVSVQMAEPGDDVADASVTWPDSRTEIPFGTLTVTARVDDQVPERRKIIFDPLPRVDGIDSSGDPLTEVRADVYLLSGRRRRAVFGDGRR